MKLRELWCPLALIWALVVAIGGRATGHWNAYAAGGIAVVLYVLFAVLSRLASIMFSPMERPTREQDTAGLAWREDSTNRDDAS